ncbi:glutamate racemase [Parvibaculum lavamentivorans DS-1]|uniref:Glutamate racemase n=1 Tax=Parvibaculum lavamentivorans (strain DS-1 / DSM 13023 / NCIMB 13966) TaxID=402881 RepID=A7HPQ4_PARL1|nr:glutamate racemase [Parvibaculum lavamentivorans]ABS61887.1 glutamate racemase [Parvibaculum lavamentivorans DS-1]
MSDKSERAIGVFDSGIGGITVLKALRAALPHEDLVYLGDTARLPYGTKSPETVTAYATQATKHLMEHGVKMVVIACNTASAVAIGPLTEALKPLPVIGVIEPGAKAGVAATKSGRIGVIGTEATVRGGAYMRAIHALDPKAQVTQAPCGLFVTLAEEGWTSGEVAEAAAKRYLAPLFKGRNAPDTLVLGCTHFPVLARIIKKVVGKNVKLVDSAATTAKAVEAALAEQGLASRRRGKGKTRFLATDSAERFARVGGIFFGETIRPKDVELVDIRPS